MHGRFLITLLVAAVATLAVAEQTIVFKDGRQLEVTAAKVVGQQVHMKLDNGRMQAWPVSAVDLASSGLLPEKAAAKAPEVHTPPKLTSAVGDRQAETAARITDADVSHVDLAAADAADAADAATDNPFERASSTASLVVSDVKQVGLAGGMKLSGNVRNAGSVTVNSVKLNAIATDGDGGRVGSGSSTIGGDLAPNASASFEMAFPVSGDASNVRVTATAAVVDFDFEESTEGAVEADAADEADNPFAPNQG